MNSLDSYDFIQVMQQLQHGKPLTDIEYYFLFTCWEYLSVISLTKQELFTQPTSIDLIHYLADELLTRLERLLDESPSITPRSLAYIFEQCHQLLNIDNLRSFDKHAPHVIDHLTKILQNSPARNIKVDARSVVALDAFYNLSTNADICAVMKKRQLVPLFKKYISTTNIDEIRKLAFNILAQIMDEQEINSNPSEITRVFIDELKHLDPNGYNSDVDNALSSLKGMMIREK
jgi:hypothetical protein